MKLTEDRQLAALGLRRAGKTFAAIGLALGVSGTRAREIYRQAERNERLKKTDPLFGLSIKTLNVLSCNGIKDRESLSAAWDNGTLRKGIEEWRLFGWWSLREVARFLQKPEPYPVKTQRVCPHCGKEFVKTATKIL